MEESASEAGNRSSSCFISGSCERKREMMNCHLSQGWTAGEKGNGTGRKGTCFGLEFIITGGEAKIYISGVSRSFCYLID